MNMAQPISSAQDATAACKRPVNPVGQALARAIEREIRLENSRMPAETGALAQPSLQVRVLLRPLGEPPLVSLGAEDCVSSASTIKTLILLAALRRAAEQALPLVQKIAVAQEQLLPDSAVFPQVLCAYNEAERTQRETDCTLEELLTWMITRSDNTATNVLIDWLGMDAVNETARLLGLRHTVLRRKMLDFEAAQEGRDNTTSAADQYKIFAAFYCGAPQACDAPRERNEQKKKTANIGLQHNAKAQVQTQTVSDSEITQPQQLQAAFLPPALQQKARDILCAQRDGEVLLRYLWHPVRVAHKTGELDTVRHDAGVFETNEPYFLAVLITHAAHAPHATATHAAATQAAAARVAEELAGRIGRLVYETQAVPAASIRAENTPPLETQRLLLRKFEPTDAAALFSILSDETANTFLPWHVIKTQEEATAFLNKTFLAYEQKKSAYRYAICLKTDNVPIGYAWLSDGEEYDFGYGLKREFWHKGIATEACTAVLAAIRRAGYPFVTATHDANNPCSGAVMKKLGMVYRYSYVEQWQPKNIAVTFKLYQLNFDGNPARTYLKYWQASEIRFIEEA